MSAFTIVEIVLTSQCPINRHYTGPIPTPLLDPQSWEKGKDPRLPYILAELKKGDDSALKLGAEKIGEETGTPTLTSIKASAAAVTLYELERQMSALKAAKKAYIEAEKKAAEQRKKTDKA